MYLARPMRFLVLTGLVLLPLASGGCKSNSAVGDGPKSNRTIQATLVTNKPAIRPADIIAGRIIAVREPLRFVIIDFPGSRMPRLDQQLNVYRLDQKVAELKVSGPFLGTTV